MISNTDIAKCVLPNGLIYIEQILYKETFETSWQSLVLDLTILKNPAIKARPLVTGQVSTEVQRVK